MDVSLVKEEYILREKIDLVRGSGDSVETATSGITAVINDWFDQLA